MGADRLLEVPVLAVTLLASSGAVVLCSRATGQRVAEGPYLRLPLASLQVLSASRVPCTHTILLLL